MKPFRITRKINNTVWPVDDFSTLPEACAAAERMSMRSQDRLEVRENDREYRVRYVFVAGRKVAGEASVPL